jgi:hypothetical protein
MEPVTKDIRAPKVPSGEGVTGNELSEYGAKVTGSLSSLGTNIDVDLGKRQNDLIGNDFSVPGEHEVGDYNYGFNLQPVLTSAISGAKAAIYPALAGKAVNDEYRKAYDEYNKAKNAYDAAQQQKAAEAAAKAAELEQKVYNYDEFLQTIDPEELKTLTTDEKQKRFMDFYAEQLVGKGVDWGYQGEDWNKTAEQVRQANPELDLTDGSPVWQDINIQKQFIEKYFANTKRENLIGQLNSYVNVALDLVDNIIAGTNGYDENLMWGISGSDFDISGQKNAVIPVDIKTIADILDIEQGDLTRLKEIKQKEPEKLAKVQEVLSSSFIPYIIQKDGKDNLGNDATPGTWAIDVPTDMSYLPQYEALQNLLKKVEIVMDADGLYHPTATTFDEQEYREVVGEMYTVGTLAFYENSLFLAEGSDNAPWADFGSVLAASYKYEKSKNPDYKMPNSVKDKVLDGKTIEQWFDYINTLGGSGKRGNEKTIEFYQKNVDAIQQTLDDPNTSENDKALARSVLKNLEPQLNEAITGGAKSSPIFDFINALFNEVSPELKGKQDKTVNKDILKDTGLSQSGKSALLSMIVADMTSDNPYIKIPNDQLAVMQSKILEGFTNAMVNDVAVVGAATSMAVDGAVKGNYLESGVEGFLGKGTSHSGIAGLFEGTVGRAMQNFMDWAFSDKSGELKKEDAIKFLTELNSRSRDLSEPLTFEEEKTVELMNIVALTGGQYSPLAKYQSSVGTGLAIGGVAEFIATIFVPPIIKGVKGVVAAKQLAAASDDVARAVTKGVLGSVDDLAGVAYKSETAIGQLFPELFASASDDITRKILEEAPSVASKAVKDGVIDLANVGKLADFIYDLKQGYQVSKEFFKRGVQYSAEMGQTAIKMLTDAGLDTAGHVSKFVQALVETPFVYANSIIDATIKTAARRALISKVTGATVDTIMKLPSAVQGLLLRMVDYVSRGASKSILQRFTGAITKAVEAAGSAGIKFSTIVDTLADAAKVTGARFTGAINKADVLNKIIKKLGINGAAIGDWAKGEIYGEILGFVKNVESNYEQWKDEEGNFSGTKIATDFGIWTVGMSIIPTMAAGVVSRIGYQTSLRGAEKIIKSLAGAKEGTEEYVRLTNKLRTSLKVQDFFANKMGQHLFNRGFDTKYTSLLRSYSETREALESVLNHSIKLTGRETLDDLATVLDGKIEVGHAALLRQESLMIDSVVRYRSMKRTYKTLSKLDGDEALGFALDMTRTKGRSAQIDTAVKKYGIPRAEITSYIKELEDYRIKYQLLDKTDYFPFTQSYSWGGDNVSTAGVSYEVGFKNLVDPRQVRKADLLTHLENHAALMKGDVKINKPLMDEWKKLSSLKALTVEQELRLEKVVNELVKDGSLSFVKDTRLLNPVNALHSYVNANESFRIAQDSFNATLKNGHIVRGVDYDTTIKEVVKGTDLPFKDYEKVNVVSTSADNATKIIRDDKGKIKGMFVSDVKNAKSNGTGIIYDNGIKGSLRSDGTVDPIKFSTKVSEDPKLDATLQAIADKVKRSSKNSKGNLIIGIGDSIEQKEFLQDYISDLVAKNKQLENIEDAAKNFSTKDNIVEAIAGKQEYIRIEDYVKLTSKEREAGAWIITHSDGSVDYVSRGVTPHLKATVNDIIEFADDYTKVFGLSIDRKGRKIRGINKTQGSPTIVTNKVGLDGKSNSGRISRLYKHKDKYYLDINPTNFKLSSTDAIMQSLSTEYAKYAWINLGSYRRLDFKNLINDLRPSLPEGIAKLSDESIFARLFAKNVESGDVMHLIREGDLRAALDLRDGVRKFDFQTYKNTPMKVSDYGLAKGDIAKSGENIYKNVDGKRFLKAEANQGNLFLRGMQSQMLKDNDYVHISELKVTEADLKDYGIKKKQMPNALKEANEFLDKYKAKVLDKYRLSHAIPDKNLDLYVSREMTDFYKALSVQPREVGKIMKGVNKISKAFNWVQQLQLSAGIGPVNALATRQALDAIMSRPTQFLNYMRTFTDAGSTRGTVQWLEQNFDFLATASMYRGNFEIMGAFGDLNATGLDEIADFASDINAILRDAFKGDVHLTGTGGKIAIPKRVTALPFQVIERITENPTFQRFIPMLQSKMLYVEYTKALKSLSRGKEMSQELVQQAMNIAWDVHDKFWHASVKGAIFENTSKKMLDKGVRAVTGQQKQLADTIGSMFFALEYRLNESNRVISSAVGAIKSIFSRDKVTRVANKAQLNMFLSLASIATASWILKDIYSEGDIKNPTNTQEWFAMLSNLSNFGKIPIGSDANGVFYLDPFYSLFTLPNTFTRGAAGINNVLVGDDFYIESGTDSYLFGKNAGIAGVLVNEITSNLQSPLKATIEAITNHTYFGSSIYGPTAGYEGYDPMRDLQLSVLHILNLDSTNPLGQTLSGSGMFQHEYAKSWDLANQGKFLQAALNAVELPVKWSNMSGRARASLNGAVTKRMSEYYTQYNNDTIGATDEEKNKAYEAYAGKVANLFRDWDAVYHVSESKDKSDLITLGKVFTALFMGNYDKETLKINNIYQSAGIDGFNFDMEEGESLDDYYARKNEYYEKLYAEYDKVELNAKKLAALGIPTENYLSSIAGKDSYYKTQSGIMKTIEAQVKGNVEGYKDLKPVHDKYIDTIELAIKNGQYKEADRLAEEFNGYLDAILYPYVDKYGNGWIQAKSFGTASLSSILKDLIIIPYSKRNTFKTSTNATTGETVDNRAINFLMDRYGVNQYHNNKALVTDRKFNEAMINIHNAIISGKRALAKSLVNSLWDEYATDNLYIGAESLARLQQLRATYGH